MDQNNLYITEEQKEALIRCGQALVDAFRPVIISLREIASNLLDNLSRNVEQYQMTEWLHPRKKKRGTIRRKRQGRLS